MRLHNHIPRDPCLALQTIDVLREQLQQQSFLVQQIDKRVRDGRPVLPRVQLLRQGIERQRVLPEVIDVEDGFRVGEIEPLEIGVEPRFWGAEVGDTG